MKFNKILIPTDFSPTSFEAFRKIFPQLKESSSEFHFLHVVGLDVFATTYGRTITVMPDIITQLERAADGELKEFAAKLCGKDMAGSKFKVVIGNPVEEICEYAGQQKIDLIAIPTHGRHGFHRFLMGSVAERVIRFAPCPVFVLRVADPEK
jgi:nucleotide-binding universal stress UspA family protein